MVNILYFINSHYQILKLRRLVLIVFSSFAHNGNLINAPKLKAFLDEEGHRHLNTESGELCMAAFVLRLTDVHQTARL